MRTIIRLALAVSLAGAVSILPACAGDEGQGDHVLVSSNLAADRRVTSLSAKEAATLCDATLEGLRKVISQERVCLVSAAGASDDPADCAARRDECAATSDAGLHDRDEVCRPYPSDCAVTVGAHEACWNAALASTDQLLDTVSCDDAARLSREAVVGLKVDFSVPECAVVSACR